MEGELNSGMIHSKNILKSASINEKGILPYDGETIKFHDVMTIMADNSLDQIFWQCKKYKTDPLEIPTCLEKVEVLSVLIRSNPFLDVDRLRSIQDLAFGIHYWKKKDSKKSRCLTTSKDPDQPMKLYAFCVYYQSVRFIKFLNQPPFYLCFGLTCYTPYYQRLEDNIMQYQHHNPIIDRIARFFRIIRYCSNDIINKVLSCECVCESDEFKIFVEIMLSSPEISELEDLTINCPIPERVLACFNNLLGIRQNLKFFTVNDKLNVMLPAYATKLWLRDFNCHIPAVWYNLSNLTQLTKLIISSGSLDETDCDQLIQFLGNNTTLEDLSIYHVSIPQDKMESLIEIIGNLSRMQRLQLNKIKWDSSWSISLGEKRRKLIWEPLKRLQALKDLSIDQKTVTIDFNSVISIVHNFYQLKFLDLRKFRLRDSQMANLMILLRYRPLNVLWLNISSFSLKSLKKLVSEAERNTQLETVFLYRCLFIEGLTQAGDQFNPTFRRPQEVIEADKQAALHIAQSCSKIRFEILFN